MSKEQNQSWIAGTFPRVEVIDHTQNGSGRALVKRIDSGVSVELSVQDDRKTLKIFLSDKQ